MIVSRRQAERIAPQAGMIPLLGRLMGTRDIILLAIGAYLMAMLALGLAAARHGRRSGHQGFIIGGRQVGYLATLGSLAASFRDGAGVVFWVGFGLTVGYGGMWIFVGALAALLVFAAVGPAISDRARGTDDITIGDLLRTRLGPATERTISAVIVIIALMVIAMQLYVAGNLFATVLDSSPPVGVIAVVAIVGVYLLAGGYRTVVLTDVIQFFLIASLALVPLVEVPPREKVLAFETLFALGPHTSVAFAVLGFFVTLGSAENWQRVYSARNRQVIRFGFPLAGVAILWMNLSLLFVGMAMASRLGPIAAPADAFYRIFELPISPWLLALLAVVVMAACMSTLDTLGYLTASTLARNLLPARLTNTREAYVRLTRIVVLVVLVAMGGMALTISDFIRFMFQTVSLVAVLGPVYLAAAIGLPRRPDTRIDRGVTLATIASLVLYIFLFARGHLDQPLMLLVPPLVNAALCGGIIALGSRGTAGDA